jgi:type IV pilus assembly protein PilW
MNMPNTSKRSGGFTIVELMVTLAISSVLLLGAVTFLNSADKSNRVQTALSGMNVSGRFGLDQVTRDLRMSGYRDSNWNFGPLGDSVAATNGASALGGDILTVLFESARDCNFALAPGGIVTNVYRVVNKNLECNGQPITAGVEEMQILFGEDTDADRVANRWLSPGTAGLNMVNVVSVRVHLLVVTEGNNVATGAQDFYYNNAKKAAKKDGQIRREFWTVVALRNPI